MSLIARRLYGHPDGCGLLRMTLEENSTGLGGSSCTETTMCCQDLPFLFSVRFSFIVRLCSRETVRRVL